jgi:threonylcarbamoyladenosine tRNA methylthiotransferase MtaB
MDISYLHVFKYSERDNTEAAEMLGVVPENVRVKRSKMMRGLSVKKRRSFMKVGNTRTVLLKAKIKRVTFMVLLKTTLKVKPVESELVNTYMK